MGNSHKVSTLVFSGIDRNMIHSLLPSTAFASVNWVSIGLDNGLSPDRRQAIIYSNAGILLIWPLGTKVSEIRIKIQSLPFTNVQLKILPEKWRALCPAGN